MADPAVHHLSEALNKREAFGVDGRPPPRALPKLPRPADGALLNHLARRRRAVVRIRGLGINAGVAGRCRAA